MGKNGYCASDLYQGRKEIFIQFLSSLRMIFFDVLWSQFLIFDFSFNCSLYVFLFMLDYVYAKEFGSKKLHNVSSYRPLKFIDKFKVRQGTDHQNIAEKVNGGWMGEGRIRTSTNTPRNVPYFGSNI